jgi:hypothetical protein
MIEMLDSDQKVKNSNKTLKGVKYDNEKLGNYEKRENRNCWKDTVEGKYK